MNKIEKGTIIFSHYGCLGHTSRVLSLAQYLNLSIISLSEPQSFLDYFQLSPPIKFCPYPVFGTNAFFSKDTQKTLFNKNRIHWLYNQTKDKSFIIFEYFPFGRHQLFKEFITLTKALKKRNVAIFSSAGYPILNPQHINNINYFMKLIDHVFFHCCYPEIEFWVKENPHLLQFLRKYKDKISFTGYIDTLPLPLKNVSEKIPPIKNYILLTRGSGIVMDELVSKVITLSKTVKENFLILLGPANKNNIYLRQDNLHIINATPHIDSLIHYAKLVISTSSYNTSVKILKYNKPTILVPFTGTKHYPNLNEQPTRARFMQQYLSFARILDIHQLTSDNVTDILEKSTTIITEDKTKNTQLNFDGLINTKQQLIAILQ